MLQRGNVDEAFKSVDRVYEGKGISFQVNKKIKRDVEQLQSGNCQIRNHFGYIT